MNRTMLHRLAEQYSKEFMRGIADGMSNSKKEAPTMKVSYNGFTGELVKLERETIGGYTLYILSIYDSERQVTHSFAGVKLEDVRFLGGAVSFQ